MRSTADVYNKLLQGKQESWKALGVRDSTIKLLQDRLENTVSIHWATLALKSWLYYREPSWEAVESREEKVCFGKDIEKDHNNVNDLYVIEKIVRNANEGSLQQYVVQWYGCSNADDTPEPLYHIPQWFVRHLLVSMQQTPEAKYSLRSFTDGAWREPVHKPKTASIQYRSVFSQTLNHTLR